MSILLALALSSGDHAHHDRMMLPPKQPVRACQPVLARPWVGKPATPAHVAQIKQTMGAQTIRVLKYGQIVTQEYMFGRVNVIVDAKNKIIRVNCG